jgi:hypothetical protein
VQRRFHHVLEHVHVRPQIEVLEHHRQLGADALKLLVIGHFERAVTVGLRAHGFAVDDDLARVRPLEKLMQRRNVLLPEPLAPMMLITSPAFASATRP